MTVAVAHQAAESGGEALAVAAREAALRDTTLAVIHVADAVDGDVTAASRAGVSDAVDEAIRRVGVDHVTWDLHLVAGGSEKDEVVDAILEQVNGVSAELLVIGARRRSPVGKAFLGSVTQKLILGSDTPVLVVPDAR